MKKRFFILLLTLTILTTPSSTALYAPPQNSEELSTVFNSYIIHIKTAIPAPSSDNLPGYGS